MCLIYILNFTAWRIASRKGRNQFGQQRVGQREEAVARLLQTARLNQGRLLQICAESAQFRGNHREHVLRVFPDPRSQCSAPN